MENYSWILWFVLAVGLMIAEIFTFGFVLFWFGVGGLAASLMAFAGFGFTVQAITFILVSGALTLLSRTIFSRYFMLGGGSEVKTNIDTLPGQIGTVSTESSGVLNQGAVRVYGSIWTAYPIDEEMKLIEGEKVEVIEVRGSSIYVRPVRKELGSWQDD